MDPGALRYTSSTIAAPPRSQQAQPTRKQKRQLDQTQSIHRDGGERPRPAADSQGRYFRCDIHAPSGAEERAVEIECKTRICKAGGRIMFEWEYVGGFLYDMQSPGNESPLKDGYETVQSGYVLVKPWVPFKAPTHPSLGMNPVGGLLDRLILSEREIDTVQGRDYNHLYERVSRWLRGVEDYRDQKKAVYTVTRAPSPPTLAASLCASEPEEDECKDR